MLSHYPELFKNNPYNLKIVQDDWKTLKLLEKIKRPSTLLIMEHGLVILTKSFHQSITWL